MNKWFKCDGWLREIGTKEYFLITGYDPENSAKMCYQVSGIWRTPAEMDEKYLPSDPRRAE